MPECKARYGLPYHRRLSGVRVTNRPSLLRGTTEGQVPRDKPGLDRTPSESRPLRRGRGLDSEPMPEHLFSGEWLRPEVFRVLRPIFRWKKLWDGQCLPWLPAGAPESFNSVAPPRSQVPDCAASWPPTVNRISLPPNDSPRTCSTNGMAVPLARSPHLRHKRLAAEWQVRLRQQISELVPEEKVYLPGLG